MRTHFWKPFLCIATAVVVIGLCGCDFFLRLFNDPPYATNVIVSGSPVVGEVLSVSYLYNDSDDDPQGVATYQWYRATDRSGTNITRIGGATDDNYSVTAAEVGYTLACAVTTNATTGVLDGSSVTSDFTPAVIERDTLNSGYIVLFALLLGGEGSVQPGISKSVSGNVTNVSFTAYGFNDTDPNQHADGNLAITDNGSSTGYVGSWTISNDGNGVQSGAMNFILSGSVYTGTVEVNGVARPAQEWAAYIQSLV